MFSENDLISTTLITGDPELYKTFLFEAAIFWAKEGQQVYYFASKQHETLPPPYHDRSEPSANALRLMTFIHTPTYEEWVEQLAQLPTFQRPPEVVLVDDLDEFAAYPGIHGCSRELHVARCCAILLHAAASCARASGRLVRVCAVTGTEESSRLATLAMYFDERWDFVVETPEGDSEVGRRVLLRRTDDEPLELEFCRLDDATLVLKRIFGVGAEADT